MRFPLLGGLTTLTMAAAACSLESNTSESSHQARDPIPSFLLTSATTTVQVKPFDLNGACQTLAAPFACFTAYPTGWLFYNDETDQGDPTLGSFVTGPGTPALGIGSVQITVSGTQRRNLATYQFAGTPLADITALKFRTYNPSAGNGGGASRSGYLQFNVDFNGSDTWQRRLLFLPSQNGGVTQNSWKEWDAMAGGGALWGYSGGTWPSPDGGTGLRTWSQILSTWPGIRIRVTDAQLSIRVGEPYADGYTENIDSFTFGTAAGTTIFDFEPALGACSVSLSGTTITLLADCITRQTLYIPDGWTLDGNAHTITAMDPVGGHFLGAVVRNAGTSAYVKNLTITASGLANICDDGNDRLRGILFDGAGGSITNNTITAVNQGPSGCQEGNAIEVRNFDALGNPAPTQVAVTIDGNSAANYIKNGITANGNVAATISNNSVTGNGAVGVPLAAQNGIQVAFGATAIVKGNTSTGHNYTPKSYVACGFLLYQATGVKAASNLFSNNERDQCNYGKGGGTFNPNP